MISEINTSSYFASGSPYCFTSSSSWTIPATSHLYESNGRRLTDGIDADFSDEVDLLALEREERLYNQLIDRMYSHSVQIFQKNGLSVDSFESGFNELDYLGASFDVLLTYVKESNKLLKENMPLNDLIELAGILTQGDNDDETITRMLKEFVTTELREKTAQEERLKEEEKERQERQEELDKFVNRSIISTFLKLGATLLPFLFR